jgi:FkbM family methyltransferase
VLLDIYAFLFSRTYFYRLNKALLHAALRGIGVLNYKSDAAGGETHFLRTYLNGHTKPTILDVGANEGSYSKAVLSLKKDARVFAFEPHPGTYSRLSEHVSGLGNVTAINAACGREHGQLVLYDYSGSGGSVHASLHEGVIEKVHKGRSDQHFVEVIDLDTFAADRRITVIDLLKIDTEGHELEVLKGAANLLREKRIKAIQFEFNEMNVVSRVFFKDFMELLPNYKFYRLVRNGLVRIDPYLAFRCELFAYQNIVALPE